MRVFCYDLVTKNSFTSKSSHGSFARKSYYLPEDPVKVVICATMVTMVALRSGCIVPIELALWSRDRRVDGSQSEGPQFDPRVRYKLFTIS